MIRIHSDGQKVVTNYDYDIEKIYPINHNSFVIQEKDNNCIRLLTINYEGTTFFTDKLLFRESTHQIVKILADKNNLFVLSKLGVNYIFRYFILDDNMELKSNGTIENIEENHKSFIQEFDRSMIINHNILISMIGNYTSRKVNCQVIYICNYFDIIRIFNLFFRCNLYF